MTEQFNALRSELRKASRYYGLFSAVASQLGVTPNHVRAVFYGQRKSKRVERALVREARRREKAA